jgi:hypothetical protein
MKASDINEEEAHFTSTRRDVLCAVGATATGLFAGCAALPIFGSDVKIIEWNREDDLAGETTFAVVLKNRGSETSTVVTINLHSESMGGGKTLAQKVRLSR